MKTFYSFYTDRPVKETEAEQASNSYLMSLIAFMVGLPLPIVNLIASLIFYLGNRKSSHFVRWHCTQALLAQFFTFIANTCGFWWVIYTIIGDTPVSNSLIAYIITLIIFNLLELIAAIYAAIETRKGVHISWWLYGDITNKICSH